MDNELFELCKEVYELTGWKSDVMQFEYTVIGRIDPEHRGEDDKTFAGYAYTSDYLLEKLPHILSTKQDKNGRMRFLQVSMGANSALVRYGRVDDSLHEQRADTPLKALLKLTKVLAEAGELV